MALTKVCFSSSNSQADEPTAITAQKYLSRNERSLTREADNDMAIEMDADSKSVQRVHTDAVDAKDDDAKPEECDRRRLLTELAARLARDKQLRYAQRELEMQRLMMGKGGRKKLRGAEKVEGGSEDDEDDEDEIDARKGKVSARKNRSDNDTYKPRVYKWRLERKR
jgi:U3 small nucleolar RNA-associated protein 11